MVGRRRRESTQHKQTAASLLGVAAGAAVVLCALVTGCSSEVPVCGCDAFCATLDRCGLRAESVCLDHCEDDDYSDESFRDCVCRAQGSECESGAVQCYTE